MVCKRDIKALEIIHENVRSSVKVGEFVRRLAIFVRFLIDIKVIPMSIYVFSKMVCLRYLHVKCPSGS